MDDPLGHRARQRRQVAEVDPLAQDAIALALDRVDRSGHRRAPPRSRTSRAPSAVWGRSALRASASSAAASATLGVPTCARTVSDGVGTSTSRALPRHRCATARRAAASAMTHGSSARRSTLATATTVPSSRASAAVDERRQLLGRTPKTAPGTDHRPLRRDGRAHPRAARRHVTRAPPRDHGDGVLGREAVAAGERAEAVRLQGRRGHVEAVGGERVHRRRDPVDQRDRDHDGAAGDRGDVVEDRREVRAAAADEGRVRLGQAGERGRARCR